MFDELKSIISNLSEEEQKNFYEKVKLQAQAEANSAAERKKKEEESKKFKASGHWESSDNETSMSIDIKEEQKDQIEFTLSSKTEDTIKFSMTKNEFFNFSKMVQEAYNFTKEEQTEDAWKKYITDIANAISSSPSFIRSPRRRNSIFYIR